jgi:hypothetical protein
LEDGMFAHFTSAIAWSWVSYIIASSENKTVKTVGLFLGEGMKYMKRHEI